MTPNSPQQVHSATAGPGRWPWPVPPTGRLATAPLVREAEVVHSRRDPAFGRARSFCRQRLLSYQQEGMSCTSQ